MSLLPDQRFGKYQIIERVAASDTAEIYKARLEGIGGFQRPFAIKRIRGDLSDDPAYVEQVVEHAKTSGLLTHANIVQILDLGQVDGHYFVAMEHVEGPDLGTILSRCQEKGITLPVPHAVWIAIEICKGLEYAHQRQIMRGNYQVPLELVHGDLSPSNVLVSFQGEVKLTDFGLANANAARRGEQRPDEDYAYTSPEQLSNQPIDQRADIFAAGAVLYEMLCGTNPFLARSEVRSSILQGEYEPPSYANPDIPYALELAMERALRVDPAGRYNDSTAFKDALNNFFHDSGFIFSHSTLGAFLKGLFPQKTTRHVEEDDFELEIEDETRPLRPSDVAHWSNTSNDTAILPRDQLLLEDNDPSQEENPTIVSMVPPALGEESTLIRNAKGALLGLDSMENVDESEWADEQRTEIRTDLQDEDIEPPREDTHPNQDTTAPPPQPDAPPSPTLRRPKIGAPLDANQRAFLNAPTSKHPHPEDIDLSRDLIDASILAPEVQTGPPLEAPLMSAPPSGETPGGAEAPGRRPNKLFIATVGGAGLALGAAAGFAIGLIVSALFEEPPEDPIALKANPRLSIYLPEGAVLRVDAREVPPAPPPTELSLSPGVATEVWIGLEGYEPFQQTFTLDYNDFRTLKVEAATLDPE